MSSESQNRAAHARRPDKPGKAPIDRTNAEWLRFSEGLHVLVEKAFAIADWRFSLAKVGTTADVEPNTSTPAPMDGSGFAGLSGYLEFTGGTSPTADVTLWIKDTENNVWFEGATLTSIAGRVEIRFAEAIRGRQFWLQFTNIAGSPTSFIFRGCGE